MAENRMNVLCKLFVLPLLYLLFYFFSRFYFHLLYSRVCCVSSFVVLLKLFIIAYFSLGLVFFFHSMKPQQCMNQSILVTNRYSLSLFLSRSTHIHTYRYGCYFYYCFCSSLVSSIPQHKLTNNHTYRV